MADESSGVRAFHVGNPMNTDGPRHRVHVTLVLPPGAAIPTSLPHLARLIDSWPGAELVDLTVDPA